MSENRRFDRILDAVRGSTFTPVTQLTEALGITDRTLRNDIKRLNLTLVGHGARISLKRGAGYHLVLDDEDSFASFVEGQQGGEGDPDLSSADSRFRVLLKTLLESKGFITANELADKVIVGDSAIQGYIRQAKDVLGRYGIGCISKRGEGFRLFGREEDRRDCFANEVIDRSYKSYATNFSVDEQVLFEQIDLYELADIVKRGLGCSAISITDYGLKNVMIHFALMISRVESDCIVEQTPPSIAYPDEVKNFSTSACDEIERSFRILVPEAERSYICRHLLMNARVPDSQVDKCWVDARIDQMLALIKTDYGFDLSEDEALKQGLSNHIGSIFRAVEVGNPVRNPLINTIKMSFPLAFEISLMATSRVFCEKPYVFDEENVGYVALHIGAAIERRSKKRPDRLRALIVCSFGRAAGVALKSRVDSFFSDSVETANCISFQDYSLLTASEVDSFDFIASTVPLENCPKPTALVDIGLGPRDVKAISRLVSTQQEEAFEQIRRFFSPGCFRLVPRHVEKDTLLEMMCNDLQQDSLVDDAFYASVLERERVADTSMNDVFAIPHTMKPQAIKTHVAVAILQDPLRWSEQGDSVQIVFLLAVEPGDHIEMEHLYDLLVRIVEDRHLQQELISVESYEMLMDVLATVV